MGKEAKLVDLSLEKRYETDNGLQVYDGNVTVWLPKSQVEENGDGTFTMPYWLAHEKGLI